MIKLLLLLLPLTAFAQTATVDFTPPTTRTNNEPLSPTDILGYRVFVYKDNKELERFDIGRVDTFDIEYPYGLYYLNIKTLDIFNRQSVASTAVRVEFMPSPASPPKVCQ